LFEKPARPLSSQEAPTTRPITLPREDSKEIDDLGELKRATNGDVINSIKFRNSAQMAIDIICSKLDESSPARVILEHGKLALKQEAMLDENS